MRLKHKSKDSRPVFVEGRVPKFGNTNVVGVGITAEAVEAVPLPNVLGLLSSESWKSSPWLPIKDKWWGWNRLRFNSWVQPYPGAEEFLRGWILQHTFDQWNTIFCWSCAVGIRVISNLSTSEPKIFDSLWRLLDLNLLELLWVRNVCRLKSGGNKGLRLTLSCLWCNLLDFIWRWTIYLMPNMWEKVSKCWLATPWVHKAFEVTHNTGALYNDSCEENCLCKWYDWPKTAVGRN